MVNVEDILSCFTTNELITYAESYASTQLEKELLVRLKTILYPIEEQPNMQLTLNLGERHEPPSRRLA